MKFIDFVKKIILHPGDISYDFINGRQVSLRVPVIAFFIVNALYFVVPAPNDITVQMKNRPYSDFATQLVEKKMKERKTNIIKFTTSYNSRSFWISKTLLVLIVLPFSFALFFVNYRKGLKYADHLAVAFEFMALATLYILTVISFTRIWILAIILLLLLLYAFERMAYRQRPFRAFGNATMLAVLFLGFYMIYHSCVFFITMLTF